MGTGVGAAAGGAAGAAVGAIAGPVGAAVGAVIGAVAGALAGKGVAESIDPTAEDAYWREQHVKQSYARGGAYDDFAPAYRTGYTGYRSGKSFDEREADLQMEYEGGPQRAGAEAAREAEETPSDPGTKQRDQSNYPLQWQDAREAARAAYDRVHRTETERAEQKKTESKPEPMDDY